MKFHWVQAFQKTHRLLTVVANNQVRGQKRLYVVWNMVDTKYVNWKYLKQRVWKISYSSQEMEGVLSPV